MIPTHSIQKNKKLTPWLQCIPESWSAGHIEASLLFEDSVVRRDCLVCVDAGEPVHMMRVGGFFMGYYFRQFTTVLFTDHGVSTRVPVRYRAGGWFLVDNPNWAKQPVLDRDDFRRLRSGDPVILFGGETGKKRYPVAARKAWRHGKRRQFCVDDVPYVTEGSIVMCAIRGTMIGFVASVDGDRAWIESLLSCETKKLTFRFSAVA